MCENVYSLYFLVDLPHTQQKVESLLFSPSLMPAGFFVMYLGDVTLQFFTYVNTKDQNISHLRACSEQKIITQPVSLSGGNTSQSSGTQQSVSSGISVSQSRLGLQWASRGAHFASYKMTAQLTLQWHFSIRKKKRQELSHPWNPCMPVFIRRVKRELESNQAGVPQLMRCFPHKNKEPSSVPSIHIQSQVGRHMPTVSALESQRPEDPWTSQTANLGSWRNVGTNPRWRALEE